MIKGFSLHYITRCSHGHVIVITSAGTELCAVCESPGLYRIIRNGTRLKTGFRVFTDASKNHRVHLDLYSDRASGGEVEFSPCAIKWIGVLVEETVQSIKNQTKGKE